jgi:hypothetical protein
VSALFFLLNELFDIILSFLDGRPAFVILAQTCPKLQRYAEARLLKNMNIRDDPSILTLARLLEQPPWRANVFEHLEVTPTVHSWRGNTLMPELVGRLASLKSLRLNDKFASITSMMNGGDDDDLNQCSSEYQGMGYAMEQVMTSPESSSQ